MEDSDWTKTRYSTENISPTTRNRELTVEGMKSILTDVIGEDNWEHLEVEHGRGRTEMHYYGVVVDGEKQEFEHHRCGLERRGNNIQFTEDTPEWFKWEVSLGVFRFIAENRIEDLGEKSGVHQREKALNSLMQEAENDLPEGNFLGLEYAIDTWRSAQQAITRNYL